MITITKAEVTDNNKLKTVEIRGLSTDTKPTEGIGNGSVYICIDTQEIYFFDLSSKTWKGV